MAKIGREGGGANIYAVAVLRKVRGESRPLIALLSFLIGRVGVCADLSQIDTTVSGERKHPLGISCLKHRYGIIIPLFRVNEVPDK
jgi:hypothetical protein